MKKIIYLTLLISGCFFSSCNLLTNENVQLERDIGKIESTYIYLYIIDSCEYIGNPSSITHKGNCKFCEERRNKRNKLIFSDDVY